jgi:hypothetical protein
MANLALLDSAVKKTHLLVLSVINAAYNCSALTISSKQEPGRRQWRRCGGQKAPISAPGCHPVR